MKRSMLGTYCTIWSQQNPTASLGKIVVGSNVVKLLPLFVEYAASQFAVTKMTPLPVAAPLGSAQEEGWVPGKQLMPADVSPSPWFTSKVTGGSGADWPVGALTPGADGAWDANVPDAVGVPETNGPVGTGGPGSLTSFVMLGGWCVKGAPVTEFEPTVTVPTVSEPGEAGGTFTNLFTAKFNVGPAVPETT
jgi:hypothetical protein